MRELFVGAQIVDGTGSALFEADVVIEDGVILDVGTDLDADAVWDCSGKWIMPGAIDCHVHLMVESFEISRIVETPFSLPFYFALANMRKTLNAGVTFVRDTGGADLGVKRSQQLGYAEGPGMLISVNLLSITGGHADHWSTCGFALPDLVAHPGRPDGVCDGPEEVVRRTREMLRAGADFIKVCATGGVLSPSDHPSHEQFLLDELSAIVSVAAGAGRAVAAHAHGTKGIKNAIRAGVRSIEHGTFLDDEAIGEMIEREVFLVPTLTALHGMIAFPELYREHEIAQARELVEAQRDSVSRAIRAGVKIALGSDAGVSPHGNNLQELPLLVELGMTPAEAIRTATQSGAELLGISSERGRVRPGLQADLLILDEDPTDSVLGLAHGKSIRSVIQGGKVVFGEASV